MLLLAADTSGKHGSIVLAEYDSRGHCSVFEPVPLDGGAFSAQLVPQIAALLDQHGFRKSQLDAFAAVVGPGSFTGLRVGLAAIKAFAEVLRKPVVAISLLEAVAAGTPDEVSGRVLAFIAAGRTDAYVGEFDLLPPRTAILSRPQTSLRDDDRPASSPPAAPDADVPPAPAITIYERVLSSDELFAAAEGRVVVTPHTSHNNLASVASRLVVIPPVQADVVARLACPKIIAGQFVASDSLEANYLRRSDAELLLRRS